MRKFYLGALLIIISAIGYGFMPIFALYAYKSGINVQTLLFIRFAIATIIFFAYAFFKKQDILVTRKQFFFLFLLGGVFYALVSLAYFVSIKYIPASLTALILYTYPIIVAILSNLIDKEKLPRQAVFAILISFSGLTLVLGISFAKINVIGVLLAIGAAFLYSCFILVSNRVVQELPSIVTSSYSSLFTAITFLISGLSTSNLSLSFAPTGWLPIIGLVIFSTVIAIFSFLKGLEIVASTTASALSITEALVTIISYTILFHQPMTALQLFGAAAILTGAVMVIFAKRKVMVQNSNSSV